MNADERTYHTVASFLDRQKLERESEADEQHCTKINVRSGQHRASINIYNSGKIVVGGKASQLKELLDQMKQGIEAGGTLPGQALPFEIDRFPQTIQERVPDCDPVIIRFVEEAIRCYRADALLGCAFTIGAASERAIGLLMQVFGDSITDEGNRTKYFSKINNRMISKKFDEFSACYKGCKSRPTDPVLSQDLEVQIGSMFQFCCITRNEVGHPQIIPDLDKGVLLVNLGHFATYIERIYGLIHHLRQNGVVL
jgi:hypothetical protein